MPITAGAGSAKTRNCDLIPSLSHEWQGPSYLSHPLPPPPLSINSKLELEVELGLQPRHTHNGIQVSQQVAHPPRQRMPHLGFLRLPFYHRVAEDVAVPTREDVWGLTATGGREGVSVFSTPPSPA